MLVHLDGTRTKLAAEYEKTEVDNSVQQSLQPINTQAAPKQPKNTEPAAGSQTRMGTPKIYNPTLQRMGIQMPEPRDPREVSTKLSQLRSAISNSKSDTEFKDTDLRQLLKPRDYYDSPYMDSRDSTRLALIAKENTNKSTLDRNLSGGVGALVGGSIPLIAKGVRPASILAGLATGALGYAAGRSTYDAIRKNKLREYRHYLEGNPRY